MAALASLLMAVALVLPQAEGTQHVVREVVFEGSTHVNEETLRLQLRTRKEAPYSAEVVDQDLKMLAATFQIWASASAEELPDGSMRVVFSLHDVPSVRRVTFSGNSELTTEKLSEALGLSANHMLPHGIVLLEGSPSAFALLARRLEEKYQSEGFLHCEIEWKTVKDGDDYVLEFKILEGPKVKVDHIEFEGLSEFAPRHLHSLMTTSRSFWFFSSEYKPKVLQDDVVKIEQFLRDEGYLDARVAVESVTPSDAGDEVDILIRIDQGPRYFVHSVRFEGNESFSTDELRQEVKLEAGMPYRQTLYRKDSDRIVKLYRHHGYLRATLPPRAVESYVGNEPAVDVVFKVTEGERKRVRDVKVVGNKNTKDQVVRRELDLYPGDLFDGDEMLAAEDRLRATGFFADGQGRPLAWVRNVETNDPRYEDAEMQVEDGTTGLFSVFGGIASGTGAFLGTDLSIENFDLFDLPSSPSETLSEFLDQKAFHGGGQKLRLHANPGNRYSSYYVNFREPCLTGPIEQPVFLDVDLHLNQYTSRFYDEDATGGVLTLGKQLSRKTSVSLGLRQDRITISNIAPLANPIEDLIAVEGASTVRGLIGELGWRDFDSLRNPTDGKRIGTSLEWIGGPLGGDVDVYKGSLTAEWLKPIWENEEGQRHVVDLKGTVAYANNYGRSDDVPLFERYFAGGPGDFLELRGFDFRGVGPHDGNFSLGGGAGWAVNSEYVFPLMDIYDARLRESEPFIRGVLFMDQGMLDDDWGDLAHAKWRMSVGVGVRLRIPIPILNAPLEFFYSIPYQRADEDERQSFQINFSTRF